MSGKHYQVQNERCTGIWTTYFIKILSLKKISFYLIFLLYFRYKFHNVFIVHFLCITKYNSTSSYFARYNPYLCWYGHHIPHTFHISYEVEDILWICQKWMFSTIFYPFLTGHGFVDLAKISIVLFLRCQMILQEKVLNMRTDDTTQEKSLNSYGTVLFQSFFYSWGTDIYLLMW